MATMSDETLEKMAKAAGVSPDDLKQLFADQGKAGMQTQKVEDGFIPGPDWPGRIPSEREVLTEGALMPVALRPKEEQRKPIPEIAKYEKETGEKLDTGEIMILNLIRVMVGTAAYLDGPPWHVDADILKLEMTKQMFPQPRIDSITKGTSIYYTERVRQIFGGKTLDASIAEAKKLRAG